MCRKGRLIGVFLFLALLFLAGCGGADSDTQSQGNDETAVRLAKDIEQNKSTYFGYISDVKELPSPLAIVVKADQTYFLESEDLPIAAPEEAQGLLLAKVSANNDETYSLSLTMADRTGQLSVGIANNQKLDSIDELVTFINENYRFQEGASTLLSEIKAYEDELAGRDYLTAINKSKDAYVPGVADEVSALTAAQVNEPMVYMMDEDFACNSIDEDTIAFIPAESKQYVPPGGTNYASYTRPDISGPISLGLSNVGRPADSDPYTVQTVQEKMAKPGDTFVFLEVVDTKYYSSFNSKKSDASGKAYTYNMRFSVITLDGRLLGYTTVSYSPSAGNSSLGNSLNAMTLALDKNDMAVFKWEYRSAFWQAIPG